MPVNTLGLLKRQMHVDNYLCGHFDEPCVWIPLEIFKATCMWIPVDMVEATCMKIPLDTF